MTMNMTTSRSQLFVIAAIAVAGVAAAQDEVEQRLRALEQHNQALERQLQAFSQELERHQLGGLVPPLGSARNGLGRGAAKVYDASGLSLGGYGEMLFTQRSGETDEFDALRAVLYIGYRFDEHWLFDSELEVEHATTEASSGTTAETGAVSLEFGFLDYQYRRELNGRAGLLLMPMGLVNEQHEPTAYLPSARAETERRILPSTWSEMGAGIYGETDSLQYRLYGVAGFDGERFDASGLREGRQGGSRSAADDFGVVGRLDYVGCEQLLFGASAYYGDAGQDQDVGGSRIPALATTILDAHCQWRSGRWTVRALYATSFVDGAGSFDTVLGAGLARRMEGYYGEVGYDVMPWLAEASTGELLPFVRYEHIDTQKQMPMGVARDASQDDEIFTIGVHYRPIPQLAIKVDFANWDNDPDQFHVSLGYVF